MNKKILEKLREIFRFYPVIKLVYFFGSMARKEESPLSDYDFALYFDEKDNKKIFEIKFELQAKISNLFRTDKIDLIILNLTESPELKYNIIKEGELIFEEEPHKILVEPKILTEYFDFRALLLKYNLTKA